MLLLADKKRVLEEFRLMAVESNSTPNLRHILIILAFGLVGLAAGALGGYFGYSYKVIFKSPLIYQGSPNDSPFDQTYWGMARLGGLEAAVGTCDGKAVRLGTIERERQIIDQIEVSAKKANLDPPLNVARAIVAYRSGKAADIRSEEEASGYANQGMMFLQAAGWQDASPDRLATIVRESDGCQQQGGIPKEKK